MTLDPQAARHLARQAALGLPPLPQLGPQEARRLNEEGAAALAGPGEDVQVRDTEIAGLPVRVYPVTDCDLDRPSYLACASGYGLTRDAMRWFWEQYLGDARRDHPEAAPLRAPSLAGAPPALVMICQYDPLRDEGAAYAERLRQSGVPVELIEQHGMTHGFFRQGAVIDRAVLAYDQCAAALRRAFAGPSCLPAA